MISPIDDFTGLVIANGVAARIKSHFATAKRSLQGHLIFERLHPADRYVVAVNPKRAGYFTPNDIEIVMPQDRDTRRLRLIRKPEYVVDGEAAIVRGQVVRDGEPAEGVAITGSFDGSPRIYNSRTNKHGNFAIRLTAPSPDLSGDPVPVPVTGDARLVFDDGTVQDEIVRTVEDMRTLVLDTAIDLSGP